MAETDRIASAVTRAHQTLVLQGRQIHNLTDQLTQQTKKVEDLSQQLADANRSHAETAAVSDQLRQEAVALREQVPSEAAGKALAALEALLAPKPAPAA
jgi:predicted  nucleic acid-binding Zn-ribbon protein